MNRTIFSRCLITACAGVALGLSARAVSGAVLAYEAVDGYVEGDLIGQTYLGAGFDSTQSWAEDNVGGGHYVNVVAGGLTYSKDGEELLTTGNQHIDQEVINGGLHGLLDVSALGPFANYLHDTQADRIGQGTLYFSVLGRANDTGGWGPYAGTLSYNAGVNNPAIVQVPKDDTTHLFVGKVEFNAGGGGEDLFSSWIDPTPGSAEGDGTLIADQVDLTADGDWQDGFNMWLPRGGNYQAWDEVRIGESWADVTPSATPIPEPSTLALGLLALVGLIAAACRRRSLFSIQMP